MPSMVDTRSTVEGLAARGHTRNVTVLYVLRGGEWTRRTSAKHRTS